MDWIASIPVTVWAALLTPLIIGLLLTATSAPVVPEADGWMRLRPSFGLYLVGLVGVVGAIAFSLMPLLALKVEDASQVAVFLIIAPPLALLFWAGVYSVLIVAVRFNSEGIRYRGLVRTLFVPWSEVSEIVDSVTLGTFVLTKRGRLSVLKFLRGFPQFVEEAGRHGVGIRASL